MHPNYFSITSPLALFFFLFALIRIPTILCVDDPRYSDCRTTIRCGSIANIGYPFWGINRTNYCGQPGFELKCEDNVAKITMSRNTLRILDVNPQQQILKIAREDYWNSYCPMELINTTINFNQFNYGTNLRNLTLFYGCYLSSPLKFILPSKCTINGAIMDVSYVGLLDPLPGPGACHGSVTVPIYETAAQNLALNPLSIIDALRGGFELQWGVDNDQCRRCRDSDGVCGYNQTTNSFICFCRDQPSETICSPTQGSSSNLRRKLVLGFGAAASSLLITCIITLCFRRKITCIRTTGFLRKYTKSDRDIEAFIRNNGTLAPKRYSYSEVKKLTNSFKEELGKGGYGSVYKGKLPDGHLVAVKVLNKSKGNGEEFINEVASISRTSHVNVVTLLGFCLEGRRRALIYEFMPNGSLERFIYKENTLKKRQHLSSEELYKIAIGIARGLEYLHRGCNTRILHFDIKPHNILLDERFCPKISDFGLAKVCTKKETIVSMLEARGTIGYIAPEVFCRSVGGVSHKSDVYSYGMVILEMVGGRRNVDAGVSQTSEIYFPDWIHRHLEQGNVELKLLGFMTREETELARKMILVGLWCIQTNPSCRPSISKVIEMLEGSIEVLQIPPKPYPSSPPRSPVDSTSLPLS